MKTALYIILGAVLLSVVFAVVLVYTNTHPPKYHLSIPPSEYRADYEAVSFASGDGILLRGWLVKSARSAVRSPAIIICHGVGANKSDFTELAVSLSRREYAVLLFDFRAHGESGGSRTSLGYLEQQDIAAALEFLKNRHEVDPARIGIYGFSLGASSAILAAAKTRAFSAVVADSAFTSLRDQARDAIRGFYHLPSFPFLFLAVAGYELYFQVHVDRIAPVGVVGQLAPTPVFIIAGEGDALVPADNGRKLYAAAREPKEFWLIPGADHGATLSAAGDEYEKKVGAFFDRYVK